MKKRKSPAEKFRHARKKLQKEFIGKYRKFHEHPFVPYIVEEELLFALNSIFNRGIVSGLEIYDGGRISKHESHGRYVRSTYLQPLLWGQFSLANTTLRFVAEPLPRQIRSEEPLYKSVVFYRARREQYTEYFEKTDKLASEMALAFEGYPKRVPFKL